ncbi:putative lipase protein [Xenorhabdus bovienii str. Jollieti]|uniref:Putative lipase protein n=1 Tax=Xenorhabdus bovienii (strain SS-2004) TaxID=406818 RepID=D3V078_XENBS|nr:lipase family protein [Xenorhabdus bovienii]CBJ80630.1 putative lipase protein [Xenorhabdus bovienii SS-2004]CDH30339.1 putative lipase protein [Xenorhabdus bovienii str. Jollieti]
MSNANSIYCHDCSGMLKNKIEIQLVDEHNKPITNMPYTLKNHKMAREGITDGNGMIHEEHLTSSPLRLFLDGQKLADEMEQRPLRLKRYHEYTRSTESMAKISAVFAESQKSGRQYRYAKIGELVDKIPVIEGWKEEDPLPSYHFPDSEPMGIEVMPTAFERYRYVIEVCPFRAWSLVLHHQKDYSLVNAYNLSLMSILTYSNDNSGHWGSVTHFFNKQLLDLSRSPYQVNDERFMPVVYDVPFSERYTKVVYIDSKVQGNTGHTQLFYAANKQEIIVGWRGTEMTETQDLMTDGTFQPIELGSTANGVSSGFSEKGKVHKGFWDAFHLITEIKVSEGNDKKTVFEEIIKLTESKKLFVCGHSLGGALALLHSAQLKSYNPCLYTYGMPRLFTQSAVQELTEIIHYRHVNENDFVPSVPFNKDMDNVAFQAGRKFLGYAIEVFDAAGSLEAKIIKSNNSDNDPFLHHGKLVYFYALPDSESKFYLLPELNEETIKTTQKFIKKQKNVDRYIMQDIHSFFQGNENPTGKRGTGLFDHSSTLYAEYIDKRLRELCSLSPDKKLQRKPEDLSFLESQPNSIRAIFQRAKTEEYFFLREIDNQLAITLEVTQKDERGPRALKRYFEKR